MIISFRWLVIIAKNNFVPWYFKVIGWYNEVKIVSLSSLEIRIREDYFHDRTIKAKWRIRLAKETVFHKQMFKSFIEFCGKTIKARILVGLKRLDHIQYFNICFITLQEILVFFWKLRIAYIRVKIFKDQFWNRAFNKV